MRRRGHAACVAQQAQPAQVPPGMRHGWAVLITTQRTWHMAQQTNPAHPQRTALAFCHHWAVRGGGRAILLTFEDARHSQVSLPAVP